MKYRIKLLPEAIEDLRGMSDVEQNLVVEMFERIAASPWKHSESASLAVHPRGGMTAWDRLTDDVDSTYFVVNFRYSADERFLIIQYIDVYRPPGNA